MCVRVSTVIDEDKLMGIDCKNLHLEQKFGKDAQECREVRCTRRESSREGLEHPRVDYHVAR